jgi:hypothetical protein
MKDFILTATILISFLPITLKAQSSNNNWVKKRESIWLKKHMRQDTIFNIGGVDTLIIKTGDTITFGNPRDNQYLFSYIFRTPSYISSSIYATTDSYRLTEYMAGEHAFVNSCSIIKSANYFGMHLIECGPSVEVTTFIVRSVEQYPFE